MNYALLIPLAAAVIAVNSFSQDQIYRCGNEYTNTVPSSQRTGCKLVEGGNVTVVQGTRPGPSAPARASAAPSAGPKVDSSEQKSRDSDAKLILEAELKEAEARNHQKYLDRVAELKASLARIESDISGIRRELGRAPATAGTPSTK